MPPNITQVIQHVSGSWLAKSYAGYVFGYKTIYATAVVLIAILGASIFGIYNHFGSPETLNKSVLFK